MAYNTSKGTRDLGDIQNESDKDTQIDFGSDQISLKTNNIDRLTVTNNHVSCSVNVSGSQFYGDGQHLTNVAATTIAIANDANNRLVTANGSAALVGEANLTFDGTNLKLNGLGQVTGSLELTGSGQSLLVLNTRDADTLKEIVFKKDGAAAAAIQINSAEHLFIENENTKDIILRANNQNALRVIGSQRRVVIGSVSKTVASAQLDVEGSAVVSGSFTVSGSGAVQRKTVIDQTHVSSSLNISGAVFYGGGAGLSNIPAAAVTPPGTNRHVIFNNAGQLDANAGLTFAPQAAPFAAKLSTTGHLSASLGLSGSAVYAGQGIVVRAGTGLATVIDGTHVSSSLNISGSRIYAGGVELLPPTVRTYTNATDNRVLTSVDSDTINGESNLTFDGTTLTVNGNSTVMNNSNVSNHMTVTGNLHVGAKADNPLVQLCVTGSKSSILALYESDMERCILGVSGSGKVILGGRPQVGDLLLAGKFNISGSTSEILVSIKSPAKTDILRVEGDGEVEMSGELNVTGSIRGKQLHYTTHKWTPSDNSAQYLQFDSNGSTTSPGANNKMVTPHSGTLSKVIVRCTSAGGDTVIGFHKASNGTQDISGTATKEMSVAISAANTSYTVTFPASSAGFLSGDIVGIKVNPTSDPGNAIATCVWEFDQNN